MQSSYSAPGIAYRASLKIHSASTHCWKTHRAIKAPRKVGLEYSAGCWLDGKPSNDTAADMEVVGGEATPFGVVRRTNHILRPFKISFDICRT